MTLFNNFQRLLGKTRPTPGGIGFHVAFLSLYPISLLSLSMQENQLKTVNIAPY